MNSTVVLPPRIAFIGVDIDGQNVAISHGQKSRLTAKSKPLWAACVLCYRRAEIHGQKSRPKLTAKTHT